MASEFKRANLLTLCRSLCSYTEGICLDLGLNKGLKELIEPSDLMSPVSTSTRRLKEGTQSYVHGPFDRKDYGGSDGSVEPD